MQTQQAQQGTPLQLVTGTQTPVTPAPVTTPVTPAQQALQAQQNALQAQQAKLQAQIATLQAQQAHLANLANGVQTGQYYIINPSNAQTNVGVNNLPKAVTLILQLLPLVNNPALLPAQQAQITQLLLQAGYAIENYGKVPLARQRIAQK